jgi:DNA-directed RNA polymerase subunit RPC12/RpoP
MIHQSITPRRVLAAVQQEEYPGFCLACGQEVFGVEPDARRYECEACGARRVFGAEEILLMMGHAYDEGEPG